MLSSLQGKQIYPFDETKEEVFKRATESINTSLLPNGEYTMSFKTKNIFGKIRIENGKITLLKDSDIAPLTSKASSTVVKTSKLLTVKNGKLAKDTDISSVSLAAAVVCGHNANGWDHWRDSNNQLINTYRNLDSDE